MLVISVKSLNVSLSDTKNKIFTINKNKMLHFIYFDLHPLKLSCNIILKLCISSRPSTIDKTICCIVSSGKAQKYFSTRFETLEKKKRQRNNK